MRTKVQEQAGTPAEGPYTTPDLTVHGTVQDLTAGSGGGLPDGTAPGSSFPDGQGT